MLEIERFFCKLHILISDHGREIDYEKQDGKNYTTQKETHRAVRAAGDEYCYKPSTPPTKNRSVNPEHFYVKRFCKQ